MLRAVAVALCLASPAVPALETVRIGIASGEVAVRLSGEALSMGQDSEGAAFSRAGKAAVEVRNARGRLVVDGAPWLGDAVRFRAGPEDADAGVPGRAEIRVGELTVRGDVVVLAQGHRLLVVNVIALEDYLAAVLGSEMPRGFPDEALKAQAVAARTYALFKKLEAYGAPFHLGSSVLSQVYAGSEREDPRTLAAVEATRGEVLTHDLSPIEAYFHASCGGRTESGAAALGRDLPYLVPVDCPCGELPVAHWSTTVGTDELERAFGPVFALEVQSRTPTGRARRIRLSGDRSVDGAEFRRRLGYARLKSLWFDVQPLKDGSGFLLTGRGSGHGAGLCQWGAKALADQGWGYKEILAHYYPGTELQQLY